MKYGPVAGANVEAVLSTWQGVYISVWETFTKLHRCLIKIKGEFKDGRGLAREYWLLKEVIMVLVGQNSNMLTDVVARVNTSRKLVPGSYCNLSAKKVVSLDLSLELCCIKFACTEKRTVLLPVTAWTHTAQVGCRIYIKLTTDANVSVLVFPFFPHTQFMMGLFQPPATLNNYNMVIHL